MESLVSPLPQNANERFPWKTTLSYSLVEVIVNIINLNITPSYKQLHQLRREAGSCTDKSGMLTVSEQQFADIYIYLMENFYMCASLSLLGLLLFFI